MGLVAPSVIGAMAKLGLLPSRRQREIIRRSRDRLLERDLLVYKNGAFRLTVKGREMLNIFEAREFRFKKPKRWDGRWRLLIFDIPERQRPARDKIRRTLSMIGFERLQDSVWIYPYDCEDLVTLLKADFKVGRNLLYLIVEELENDAPLRLRFTLSK